MSNSIKMFKDFEGNSTSVDLNLSKILSNKKNYTQEVFTSVVLESASKRQSNASTLTKAEVRGGGRKPYKQKHTGNARQGSIRNPHYVGGGRAFGPSNEKNYKIKQNKKAYKNAFQSIISSIINENRLYLIADNIEIKKPSTKLVLSMLKKINLNSKKTLFILFDENINFVKSSNNLKQVITKYWNQVSIRDLLNSDSIIFQKKAFDKVVEVYA